MLLSVTDPSALLASLLAALVLDALIGDPDWLWRRLPHPVVVAGALIKAGDRVLNRPGLDAGRRRRDGLILVLGTILAAAVAGFALAYLFDALPGGWLIEGACAAVLIAQRSLYLHVRAVARAFDGGGLDAARAAVAHIVGRDPAELDRAAVCRAAIESLAENHSDGVAAPVFWYLLFGLPGLFAYKMLNTADSMIGYRDDRHRDFGWAAARLDDLANAVPARLDALLIAAAAGLVPSHGFKAAWRAARRDAPRHRSANAGWPEAAMAGALGLALAGPRSYGGEAVDDAWMNDGGITAAEPADIGRALALFLAATGLIWLGVLVAVLI